MHTNNESETSLLPADALRIIFRQMEKDMLKNACYVCKIWCQIISYEFLDALPGIMLRFSRDFLEPLQESAEKLALLEKKIAIGIRELVRSDRLVMGLLILLALLVPFQILADKSLFYSNNPYENMLKFCDSDTGQNLQSYCSKSWRETVRRSASSANCMEMQMLFGPFLGYFVFAVIESLSWSWLGIVAGIMLCLQLNQNRNLLNNQINNPLIIREINTFFNTAEGRLILDLIHNQEDSAQYPHISRNLDRSTLRQHLASDHLVLRQLINTFRQHVKNMLFSTESKKADNLCSGNKKFALYFLNKTQEWNTKNSERQIRINEDNSLCLFRASS